MDSKILQTNKTIVALATPPAASALAIIRISGSNSLKALNKFFKPVKANNLTPRQLCLGWVSVAGKKLDQAMAVYMPAPRSYTGEDVAELHLHGSMAIVQQLLNEIAKLTYVRPAEPGEFTKRAFLNNKLDLMQAEAVAELIASKNHRAATLASQQLNGSLSAIIKTCKEDIVSLSAYYVANLDFSEEDIPSLKPEQAINNLKQVKRQLQTTLKNSQYQRMAKDGLKIALVGLPNAGKSSLLNLLLGFNRAIVSPMAGTTRDIISEQLNIAGINCVLTDTAGLRHSKDAVEKIGIELSKNELSTSDHIFVLIEPKQQTTTNKYLQTSGLDGFINPKNTTIIFTKKDLGTQKPNKFFNQFKTISVSNKDSSSAKTVILYIEKLIKHFELDSIQTLTERQTNLLQKALKQTDKIILSLENNITDDVILVEIQALIEIFNNLSGEHTTEEMITEVFSNFCIGK